MAGSIFEDLNLEQVKRFEAVISQEIFRGLHVSSKNFWQIKETINMSVDIVLPGKDINTVFRTSYEAYSATYQDMIVNFLAWYDREILRFSTFNELTKRHEKE